MGEGISQNKEYGADEGRQRKQKAIVRTPNKPHRMGDHYADKSDKTGEANCGSGNQTGST